MPQVVKRKFNGRINVDFSFRHFHSFSIGNLWLFSTWKARETVDKNDKTNEYITWNVLQLYDSLKDRQDDSSWAVIIPLLKWSTYLRRKCIIYTIFIRTYSIYGRTLQRCYLYHILITYCLLLQKLVYFGHILRV